MTSDEVGNDHYNWGWRINISSNRWKLFQLGIVTLIKPVSRNQTLIYPTEVLISLNEYTDH